MKSNIAQIYPELESYSPFQDQKTDEETYVLDEDHIQDNLITGEYMLPSGLPVEDSLYNESQLFPGEILTEEEVKGNLLGPVVNIKGKQNIEGYEDPGNSGLPLLSVDEKNRAQSLARNFTVGEFAQAAGGKYKWKYYRVDLDLIKELQILRDALEKPIIIMDGYYPPKYQKEILKMKMTLNPHFSGRGIKIKSKGMTGKALAENIILYCDPGLSISVGEDTCSIYIKQKLSRVTSYIRNPARKAAVIKELQDFDAKVRASVIQVIDLKFEEIPKPLISISAPVNDSRITGEKIREASTTVSEIISSVDKFMIGKSETDNAATYFKSLKNFTKLSDDIAKIQGGTKLSELLQNDKSGLDYLGKLQLLKNSLGILETLSKLSSINEKKKAYAKFLQSNAAADIYLSVDILEGISKLTSDTISLSLAIAALLSKDAATKANILKMASDFEKISKGVSIFIEGAKIVRNLVSIIILISEGKYSETKNYIIDIGRSIVTIAATLKYGTGIVAAITGIYLFYKFFLVTLPTMVGDVNRSIAMGSTITALRELNQEFERITYAYFYVNSDYERIMEIINNDESKYVEHPNLQRIAYRNFTWFHRELYSFHKYVSELDYTTRSKSGLYKSFPSIPARIFSRKILPRIESNNLILKEYPRKVTDFSDVYAIAVNEYYNIFYEGIVKCHLEFERIYEERVQTGWGKDPFNKEIETEQTNLEISETIDEASVFSEIEGEVFQDKSILPSVTRKTIIGTQTFLSSSENSKAIKKNKELVSKAGININTLVKTLDTFVDIYSIRDTMKEFNRNNSDKSYLIDSNVDAVFTEAVHQFQILNFINTKEHDGLLGTSTLDTLGFTNHKLKARLNSSSFYGQNQLNQIKKAVARATNNEFTSENWFTYIVKPAWLGIKIADGVHVLLLQKLRAAENWLKLQPQYKGMTPVELGKAIGFSANSRYSGARLSADKQAMHAFGLAIDVNPWGNPWVGAGWIKDNKELLKERTRFIQALRNASGEKLHGNTIFAYLHHIAETSGNDTSASYKILSQRNSEFINYLKGNPSELKYWQNSATFGKRNPLDGFLNLQPDLVYALREVAGLAWGAIDFGPYASGDIMHFDMRTTGVGKIIGRHIKGYVPSKGHPAIDKEEPYTEFEFEEAGIDEYHEAIEESEWIENEFA